MIEEPDRYIPPLPSGATGSPSIRKCVPICTGAFPHQEQGIKAGVAVNPATPVALEPILTEIDLLLIMTVNPGFGDRN